MASGTLLPSTYIRVENFVSRPGLVELHAVSKQLEPACPVCGAPSTRVQSRYSRTLADLPWHGVQARIFLRVRRFFCDNDACSRAIFAERLPQVAAPYARRTRRRMRAWSQAGLARELATEFNTMVCQRLPDRFDAWLERARASGIVEFEMFAKGLERERAEVIAALRLPWSSGQVEGQVHRLKLIKRQTYGRAAFDLLRARVLHRS